MEKTPQGTGVGVDDPYAHVDVCDHLTSDGTCRFAFEHPRRDPAFSRDRRSEDLACPVVADAGPDWDWADCPHFASTTTGRECARCGLEERRLAHDDARPLIEEHHLSYADAAARRAADATGAGDARAPGSRTDSDGDDFDAGDGGDDGSDGGDGESDGGLNHEITVALCRWCHSKVHDSWARITDDASPDPEAIAAAEERRSRELDEAAFETASERYADATRDASWSARDADDRDGD